jgi:hypothetical protein
MKVKVNIREHIESSTDHNGELHVSARLDLEDLFEGNAIPEDCEIDFRDLLAENRQIAHIWGIDDVQKLRPDLNNDQAWSVLQTVDDRLDCNVGITCESVEMIARELYGARPESRLQGRIDVSVENYTRDAAMEHFTELASHIQKVAVNSTTKATFDPASLRPTDLNETSNN